jgi:small-conductance mechanosensitive channel
MKNSQKAIAAALLALLGATIAGVFLTRSGANPPGASGAALPAGSSALVDQRPMETAQRLARLAGTPEEQDFARAALLTADREVDLAFASALRNAAAHPAPLTPETRELSARVKELQGRVKADKDEATRLKELGAKASGDAKDRLQEQQDLMEAQVESDQDELDDVREDLIRAGGDVQATIQRILDAHEALQLHQGGGSSIALPPASPGQANEQTQSQSAIAQLRAWSELHAKQNELTRALEEVKTEAAELSHRHEALELEVKAEKSGKTASGKPASGAGGSSSSPAAADNTTPAGERLASLRHLSDAQKDMSGLDKRMEYMQDLETIYGDWGALVKGRKRGFLHGLLLSAFWILLIGLCTLLADPLLERLFARLAPQKRGGHALQTVSRLITVAIAVVLVLCVVFGSPSQLATVLGLAGAGLTIALKDFIVGFFGWFVLIGKNGIRLGDWVEINGIGGEVLEVGLLRTVLLETGNWSDAGHPTGRKVSFVNSFAIEGHYFNFSTTGQWLWDELEILIPEGADPFPVAEAIQKIVEEDTAANTKLAEEEWQRVVPGQTQRSFSAKPAMSVRPLNLGVNVVVRYITRAQERHEVRARLYRAIIALLRQKQIPESATHVTAPPSSGSAR